MTAFVIYLYAGLTYLVMILLLDDIAIELNKLSEKLGKEIRPLRVDLKGKPIVIMATVIFWPVFSSGAIYLKLTEKAR